MKKLLVLAALSLTAAAANARPSTWNMTCAQAQGAVAANGAVVMNYGYSEKAGYLYERFVTNDNYCDGNEQAETMWVETSDMPKCGLYVCRPNDSNH